MNGPGGLNRQVLLDDAVTIGRGRDAAVVLDDPEVSRSHAVLRIGRDREMTLEDLGSSCGTFLAGVRLWAGSRRRLDEGQTFFIGNSALVVHGVTWPAAPFHCVTSPESIRAHLAAFVRSVPANGSSIVLCVRAARPTPSGLLEALLGFVVGACRSQILRTTPDQILVSVEAVNPGDAAAFERTMFRQLASWGVGAEVEALPLSREQLETPGEEVASQLAGPTVRLKRGTVVVRDPAMGRLARTIRRVAPANVSVLILGETGSGKDVVASMIHEFSTRADKPFLGMNCASVPEALLESELFGYERGAFTGAVTAKMGLLESAQGGTVFLDEIGDLPLSLQAKLLRVIESREVTPVGSVRPREVDVRFVAATNQDIAGATNVGRFRRDLLYRLNCVTLAVPPLRERRAEIEPLARLFLARACERFEMGMTSFSPEAVNALNAHVWLGNVRELRNVVERALLLAPGSVIEPAHLELDAERTARVRALVWPNGTTPAPGPSPGPGPGTTMAGAGPGERDRILSALFACGGNQSRAAKSLGVSRRTLVRQIARLHLPRPRHTDG